VLGDDLDAPQNGAAAQLVVTVAGTDAQTISLTVVGRGNSFAVYTNGTLIDEVDPTGPRPFTEYTVNNRTASAKQMCALVANTNHSVQPASGTCFDLPDSP
jgi:hypothetical protein